MKYLAGKLTLTIVAIAVLVPSVARCEKPSKDGPLHAYVAREDDTYQWKERQAGEVAGVEFVELTLYSQTWRDIVWKHQLFIMKPKEITSPHQAIMLISGGGWKPELEQPVEGKPQLPGEATVLAQAAKASGSVVALLTHVPMQPIFDGKVEDQIIAYTFEQAMKTGDYEWPLLLPMAKSAVRAMDAVQEFASQQWDMDIENFTVTGASKRGWTTWLTGAVDSRVNAIAPIVIDVLNMDAQMVHQLETWGEYSEQIQDYTDRDIQANAKTEAGKKVNQIVDPYNYRDLVDEPKLIIIGTNDRYWVLDALNIYWDDLVGEKNILYVPNNGHGVNDFRRLLGSISALNQRAAGTITWPNLTWKLDESNEGLTLNVDPDLEAEKVVAWIATSPTRDFREVKWRSTPATKQEDGTYTYALPRPEEGYAAMFGEAVYQGPKMPYFLSTQVRVIGDLSSDKPASDKSAVPAAN